MRQIPFAVLTLLIAAAPARADVPNEFAVQGVLRDSTGKLQSMMVNVTASFFDAQTAGNKLAGPYGPTMVLATNGLFTFPVVDQAIQTKIGGAAQLWLLVTVGNDTFARQLVTPQIYALMCSTADHLSGILPISSGGTGSATQSFVDLSTTQSIAGDKSFSANVAVGGSLKIGNSHEMTYNWWEFGADDGQGAGIDFHGGTTLTDFAGRVYRAPGDSADFILENQGPGSIQVRTAATNRMTITAAGNVGINNASPSYMLDVNGPTRVDGIHLFRKGGNNGTASCATFCMGSQWGEVGLCVGGKNEGTGLFDYGCGTTLGSLGLVTCLCASY